MVKRIMLLWLLIMALAACNRGVSIEPGADGTAIVTVTLNEADVNTLIQNALAASSNPLLRNPSVDLQNGQIIISGEHDRRDGSGRVDGSVTATASVTNGTISVQVIRANIEGLELSDERIAQFNGALASRLAGQARQDNPRAILDRITITNDSLSIQIVVQVGN